MLFVFRSLLNHTLSYILIILSSFHQKKHYHEWFVIVTEKTAKSREKDKLSFYANKVEQLEKDSETPQAKQLRERFFGLEKHLR